MDFLVSAYSDVGIRKKTNQDSALIQVAKAGTEHIALCVVCDGMGGLEKGELASATLIRRFTVWFNEELKELLKTGFDEQKLHEQWNQIIQEQGKRIWDYGTARGLRCGTTCVAVLLYKDKYYCLNVGDSRAYLINERLQVLTKDQTFIQREMDLGRMTQEEAKVHPQRSVLLQCVGASEMIIPDFYVGNMKVNDVFMLCSDGFRHIISEEEIHYYLNPEVLQTEENMMENAKYLVELNKYRQEQDNITVALIKAV